MTNKHPWGTELAVSEILNAYYKSMQPASYLINNEYVGNAIILATMLLISKPCNEILSYEQNQQIMLVKDRVLTNLSKLE